MLLGQKTASSPTPPVASRINEIIVVCKTHFDIGYSDRVEDVLTYYRTTMIDRALDLIDRSKELPQEEQFTWTCPGWVFDWIVEDWPSQTAERRQLTLLPIVRASAMACRYRERRKHQTCLRNRER